MGYDKFVEIQKDTGGKQRERKIADQDVGKNQIYTVCSGLSGICAVDHLGNSKGNGAQ